MRFLAPLARLVLSLLACMTVLRAQTPSPITSPAYVIANTDRLRIAIFQEDDLSTTARVDSQGRVNLPLVGELALAGLNLAQAQGSIEQAYRDGRFLRAPKVTLSVEEYAVREVSIQGQIRTPGRYPLPVEDTMTILDLVTRAGGLTDTAKGTAVRITRIKPDGSKQNFEVNVESLIKGRTDAKVLENNLRLEADDIVFIPERII
jgi:polysaccharide biosynthesis/export protein